MFYLNNSIYPRIFNPIIYEILGINDTLFHILFIMHEEQG